MGGAPSSSGGAPSSGSPNPAASSISSGSGPKAPSASDLQGAKADADTKATPANASAGGGGGDKAPTDQFAKGLTSAQPTAQPTMSPAAASSAPVAPVTTPTDPAAAAPIQHTAASTSGGGAGTGGGTGGFPGGGTGGGSLGSPSTPAAPPMPLGPPATPPPAGPPPPTGASQPAAASTGPGVNPASTGKTDAAGVAAMPVSSARMERDAALSASTAGALQRQRGNASAALMQARRIAAALNMGAPVYGFFWVTGLATDGSIVVANSYGLGYIPDGVELPPQVTLASADESIAPGERAKWVTYPILALQGWAEAHGHKLRAVIATAEQFASFDPGVPKIVLKSDDIPEGGKMVGRSRLEVIAPAAAARLASVADGALQELLPVAPADATPPDDQSAKLWFELTKPLMSTAANRGLVHLEAFVKYAEHMQELALHKAHNAFDATAQRSAIADWVYWQHLGVLMSDAVGADATV